MGRGVRFSGRATILRQRTEAGSALSRSWVGLVVTPRHRRACSGAGHVLPPSTKLTVKFVPRLSPSVPATPTPAKVTDKATPPRGQAGEGRECGGGGARGEGAVGGGGAHALYGGPNVSQVFETGIWVFHVGQVRRGGQRAPLPALARPSPGSSAGVRARTPARARPAPEAAERWPGTPAPGPRAQAARLADVAVRGRQEGGAPAGGRFAFCRAGLRGGGGWRKRKAAPSRRGPR